MELLEKTIFDKDFKIKIENYKKEYYFSDHQNYPIDIRYVKVNSIIYDNHCNQDPFIYRLYCPELNFTKYFKLGINQYNDIHMMILPIKNINPIRFIVEIINPENISNLKNGIIIIQLQFTNFI